MSKPAAAPASTPSWPVATRMPLFGGDWIAIWSRFVSSSKSVVRVFGGEPAVVSLFVYADAVMPVAVTGIAGGAVYVSAESGVVPPVACVTSWRRFCPVSLTMRSRFAAGLKSTPNDAPSRSSESCDTKLASPVAASIV
jgi:hypothetical protein